MGKTTLKIFKGITFFNNKYKFFPHSFIKYCLRDQTSLFSPYENRLLLVPRGAYPSQYFINLSQCYPSRSSPKKGTHYVLFYILYTYSPQFPGAQWCNISIHSTMHGMCEACAFPHTYVRCMY